MKKHLFLGLFIALLAVGCTENIDMSARYTFQQRTIMDYLRSQDSTYSSYISLLEQCPVSSISKTTLAQLFTARGHYTVFAPTNKAMQTYMDSLVADGLLTAHSWDSFRDSTVRDSILRLVVLNSIIDSGDDLQAYQTTDFPTTQDAEITLPNMYDRKIVVHYGDGYSEPSVTVSTCPIDERNCNIFTTNGVIHQVHTVLISTNKTLGYWMEKNVEKKRLGYYVASMLTLKTGLMDSLNAVKDEVYERLQLEGMFDDFQPHPKHRKYGYTFFAETDSFWSETLHKPALEITVQDVVDYLADLNVYPDAKKDENYASEDNLLNRFVTYHLLNRRLPKGYIVNHYNEYGYNIQTGELGGAKMQYYSSMGQRRLVKLYESRESHGVYINRCPVLDNKRHGTYHELSCDPAKEGVRVGDPSTKAEDGLLNAVVYPIDKLLVYDSETQQNLGKERMRFDVASIPAELTNNDIRMNELMDWEHMNSSIAPDSYYPYMDDLRVNPGSSNFYYGTCRMTGWMDFEGDEVKINGYGDVTMLLPPVPTADTYEVRYRVSCQTFFGMQQIYFGNDPDNLHVVGIPVDLRRTNTSVGWEVDTDDDDYNAEVEKRMRNNDALKGANSHSGMPGSDYTERCDPISSRRILVRERMEPGKKYYLRQKYCLDYEGCLFMDYLELCPKSVYDNPSVPEDIW